jgi:lipoprotein-releasing system permease protein
MNIPYFIAKRYLFSKNNRNAINIISGISVLVVAVSTAALIIVLSSVNGFGKLIDEQISSHAPDIQISPKKGKTFIADSSFFKKIDSEKNIKYIAPILEENVLIKKDDRQIICRIKGVPENYEKQFELDTAVLSGTYKTHGGNNNFVVVGAGIAYNAGIYAEAEQTVSVWTPNRKKININNPEQSFNTKNVYPTAVISLDSEFDSKYIIASFDFVRSISERNINEVSSIEILVENKEQIYDIKNRLLNSLGNEYIIKDLYEQFDVYKVMQSERLAAFIIMLFIILVASFSIIGSVTMLIIEKREDIFTLQSIGVGLPDIKKIFFSEGILISFFGTFIGIIIGGLLCFAQEKFGFVRFPADGNYIVDAYPMQIKAFDFLLTFFSVMIIGSLISLYPTNKIKYITENG